MKYMKRSYCPRKEYYKAYYRVKIKPNRKLKPPSVMIKCPFCGMLALRSFFDKPLKTEIFLKFGSAFQKLKRELVGETAYGYAMEIYLRAERRIMQKALEFLKYCLSAGYITKEEIRKIFNLELIRSLESPLGYRPIELKTREMKTRNLYKPMELIKIG